MKPRSFPHPLRLLGAACTLWCAVSGTAWAQSGAAYYICPGNVFTNTISAREAEIQGCKSREARPPTVAAPSSAPRARPIASGSAVASAERGGDTRVQLAEQRARDSDAKRILEEELRKEEAALDALRKEYNNGEPERRGDERNAQKYLDRIAEMKAALTRKEADVAAIRRELGKMSQ